jgi:hypothetical protein
MSWPELPRINPCLPCMVGNPAVSVAQQQLFGAALALKRGEVSPKDVTPAARHLAARLSEKKLREFAATTHEGLPPRANPKKKRSCAHIDMPYSHAHIDMPYAHSAAAGGTTIETAPHGEVNPRGGPRVVWRRVISPTRFKNPKLLVLNPSDEFAAKVESMLGRKLSAKERSQLATARKEYREFHGRDPDSLVPVEVPNGTPRFVNLVGDLDRIDYTVRANSLRKGRWTHKAGDHGRTAKRTKPALLVSIPGKKSPPVFAQRKGSEMFFKPSHGIMG